MAEGKKAKDGSHLQGIRTKTRDKCKDEILALIPPSHEELVKEVNIAETKIWLEVLSGESKYKKEMHKLYKQINLKLERLRASDDFQSGIVQASANVFWYAQEDKGYATSGEESDVEDCRSASSRPVVAPPKPGGSSSSSGPSFHQIHQVPPVTNLLSSLSWFPQPQILQMDTFGSSFLMGSPAPVQPRAPPPPPVPVAGSSRGGKPNALEMLAIQSQLSAYRRGPVPNPFDPFPNRGFEGTADLAIPGPSGMSFVQNLSGIPSSSRALPNDVYRGAMCGSLGRVIDKINLMEDNHGTPSNETIVITDDEESDVVSVRRAGVTERRGNLNLCNAIYLDFEIEDGEGWEKPPVCECNPMPHHILDGTNLPTALKSTMMEACLSNVKGIVGMLKMCGESNTSSGCKTRLLLQLKQILTEQAKIAGGESSSGPTHLENRRNSTAVDQRKKHSCPGPSTQRENALPSGGRNSHLSAYESLYRVMWSTARNFSDQIAEHRSTRKSKVARPKVRVDEKRPRLFVDDPDSNTSSSEEELNNTGSLRQVLPPDSSAFTPYQLYHGPPNLAMGGMPPRYEFPRTWRTTYEPFRPERVSHPRPFDNPFLPSSPKGRKDIFATVSRNLDIASKRLEKCEKELQEATGSDEIRKLNAAETNYSVAAEAHALCRRQYENTMNRTDFTELLDLADKRAQAHLAKRNVSKAAAATSQPTAATSVPPPLEASAASTASSAPNPTAVASTDSSKAPEPTPGCSKDREKEELDCCICLDERRSVAFIPCKHLVCCATCSESVTSCPVCREAISDRITIYLS